MGAVSDMNAKNLGQEGIQEMKSKVTDLIKQFGTPDTSATKQLNELDKLQDSFKVDESEMEKSIIPEEEIEVDAELDINESEMDSLLPEEGFFDKLLPDFGELFDF